MNMVIRPIFFSVVLFINNGLWSGALEDATKKFFAPVETGQKLFVTSIEEKQAKLAELNKERDTLGQKTKLFTQEITGRLDDIKIQLDKVAEGLRAEPEDEFLNKKLTVLNDRYQVIKNIQQSHEQLVAIIDEYIELLQDYLKDPNLKNYRKSLKVEQRDSYSLEDLQFLTQLNIDKTKNIAQLQEQEKNIDTEIENRKRTSTASAKKKKEEQETSGSLTIKAAHKAELLKLDEQLIIDKNEWDSLRLKELEYKKALFKAKLQIERQELDVIKETAAKVKPAIKVSQTDVAIARDDLAKKQQQSFTRKEGYRQEIENLLKESKVKEEELQKLAARTGIAINFDLDEWNKQGKEDVESYLAFFEMGSLNDSLLLLHRKKDFIEAEIALEDETIRQEASQIDIKSSFHKVTARKFTSEDETNQERKKYDTPRADIKATLALFKERKTTDQERLNRQKKALNNLKDLRQRLQEKKNTIFKGHEQEYTKSLELLNSSEEKIQGQIDILNNISTIYNDIINVLTETAKQIDFIITELELTTIWQRSKYAITWEGVQNSIPNLEAFITDIRLYVTHIRIRDVIHNFYDYIKEPWVMLWLLLVVAVVIIVIIVCRFILPVINDYMLGIARRYRGLRLIGYITALWVSFIALYSTGIVIWLAIAFLLSWFNVPDPYPHILFYLLSIPYLLYLAQAFMRHLVQFNMQHNYIFLAKDFQKRFIIITSTLVYATIIIFLFREAFLLTTFYKSEVPTILLAVNFIIFQIALIFLIGKEQILSIIPTSNEMWRWIAVQVDRFYYLILMLVIAIIVMSNPYVGFGKLVLYVLSRVIYTIIVIRLLLWVNGLFRRGLSYVFFSHSEDTIRERFSYGKTLYGFFAIALLFMFLMAVCIIGAKIWAWPESLVKITTWSDIITWLQNPILLEKSENPLSIFSFLKILFFIVMGFVIVFAIDRFVVEKIFDVLLVEPGVQNTVSSIIQYIVIITAVILGFQDVGLGGHVWWVITGLIVGIGWVIKDPMADFVAYFIILVQRPIKIGDYIKMDADTYGVVRKITARSVVLRRKNSTTIVLPNTQVISKPLINWNYGRGFIAFDDILLTVSYKEDPIKIKELLLKIMDENNFVLKSPTPIVRLENFGTYGFEFVIRGFISSNYTLDQWDIASDIRLVIVRVLRDHGIHIAMPTHIVIGREGFFSMPHAGEETQDLPLKGK